MASLKRHAPFSNRSIRSARQGAGLLRLIWLAVALLALVSATLFAWFLYEANRPILKAAPTITLSEAEKKTLLGRIEPGIELVLPYGTSARGVAALIRDAGVDIHEGMFLLHARWLGVHRQLKAGVYLVEPGVTKKQFILRLAGKDPTHTELRVLEGWTIDQTLQAIKKNSDIQFDLAGDESGRALAGALGLKVNNPEGWLYPDVYVVKKGSQASTIVSRAVRFQRQFLAEAWQARSPDLPYQSIYEALIVASIIEKETQYPGDRERVAAVFANRIKRGMPLQADPTVIYGLGREFAGDITKKHLRKDTPYNTYTRKTLPPTPISNPGLPAIRAAMNPAPTQALFFVARGDGSSEFSETLAQHNSAVNRFIRKLSGDKP